MGYKKTDPCIKKAYDDERLFVLMARDPAAPKVILHWIAKSFETQPADKLREAFACAMEMQERGQEFRDRRDQEKKNEAEVRERAEFERWKHRQELSPIVRDGERGPEVMSHEETRQKSDVVGFGLRFAQWLKENVRIGSGQTDYESLYKSFLNSLPSYQ